MKSDINYRRRDCLKDSDSSGCSLNLFAEENSWHYITVTPTRSDKTIEFAINVIITGKTLATSHCLINIALSLSSIFSRLSASDGEDQLPPRQQDQPARHLHGADEELPLHHPARLPAVQAQVRPQRRLLQEVRSEVSAKLIRHSRSNSSN